LPEKWVLGQQLAHYRKVSSHALSKTRISIGRSLPKTIYETSPVLSRRLSEQAEWCWESGKCRKKLWGRSSRPLCRCLLQVVSAFCCSSSLLSFWLPWIYSPFPFFMEFRNGVLLQLIDV
jgi:hypothetical protein